MTPDEPKRPVVPDYELLRNIGQGSYGTVWIARSATGLYRAVKVVWRSNFPDIAPYEREFRGLKEFAAVSVAEHRLLTVLHVGRNDAEEYFYYVMELADDATRGLEIDPSTYVPRTMREFRAQRGRLPAPEALALGVDLANALAGLHDHNLVHRDIKPSNIIFVSNVTKLADVGLVASEATGDESRSRVGNTGYMPPDFPGVASADVYGLGLMLYELVTGLKHDDFPRLPPNFHLLPDRKELLELNEIFIKACAADAKARYPNAGALLEDLRLLQAGKSVRRLRAAERHLSRALRAAALLAVVAVIAGAGAWGEHQRAAEANARRRDAETERDLLAQRALYSSALIRAQEAMEREDYGRARTVLTDAPVKAGDIGLRGIEWNVLMARAHGDASDVLLSGDSNIVRLVADPQVRVLAALNADRQLTVLDPVALRPIRTVEQVGRLVGVSHDGNWVMGEDATRRLTSWSTSHAETRVGPRVPDRYRLLGLARDGGVLAADTAPWGVVLLAVRDATVLHRFPLETDPGGAPWQVFHQAVAREGDRALVTFIQGRGTAARWRVVALDLVNRRVVWEGPAPGLPVGVGILESEGAFLLSIGLAGKLMRLRNGDVEWREWRDCGSEVYLMTERPGREGGLLCAGRAPVVYEVAAMKAGKMETAQRWRGHGGRVQAIVAAVTGDYLFTASTDGSVRRWRAGSDSPDALRAWDARGGLVSLAVSPSGDAVLAPRTEDSAQLIGKADWANRRVWPQMGMPLAWNGTTVWALSPSGDAIEAWNVAQDTQPGRIFRCETGTQMTLNRPTFARDFRRVAAGTEDGRVWIWSTATGKLEREAQPHRDAPWGYAFATRQPWIWSVGNDQVLVATEVETGREIHRHRLSGRTPGVEISPDGATLALVYTDGMLELRSAEDGAMRSRRSATPGLATCACYTPDGKRLLIGSAAGTIHVVSAEDGSPVVTLTSAMTAAIAHVAIAPDRDWLALVSVTGELRRWELRREK